MRFLMIGVVTLLVCSGCMKKAEPAPTDGSRIIADGDGFTPSSITLKKGGPGTLTFVRTSDATCATEVVFPELSIKKELPLNTPTTIDIPTDTDRKLTFQCGMGMYKSAVVVQ